MSTLPTVATVTQDSDTVTTAEQRGNGDVVDISKHNLPFKRNIFCLQQQEVENPKKDGVMVMRNKKLA